MDSIEKAALAATGGRFNKMKSELKPGEYEVDMLVRVKGVMKKSADTVKVGGKKAAKINFERLFAAAVEGMDEEQIASIFNRYRNEEFNQLIENNGGDKALYEEVCGGLGVTPYTDLTRSGSVTMKELRVLKIEEETGHHMKVLTHLEAGVA